MKDLPKQSPRTTGNEVGSTTRVRDRIRGFEGRRNQLAGLSFEEGSEALRPTPRDPLARGLLGSGLVDERIERFGGRGGTTPREERGGGSEETRGAPRLAPMERDTTPLEPEIVGPVRLPLDRGEALRPRIAQTDRSEEEIDEIALAVLERRKEERDAELEALRGDAQPEGYKGRGGGGTLRRIVEDERLDYQLVRDTDEMGFAKRHGTKGLRGVSQGAKKRWRGVKDTVSTRQGLKRGARRGLKKGVGFVPVVGGIREGITAKKESKRVKEMSRLRDDENVSPIGRKMAGGLTHEHKRARMQKGIGAVGGIFGKVGGPMVSVGKFAAKGAVVVADEGFLKKDRKGRLASRLPERGETESETEHHERVDEANESLVGLLKADPGFSKALIGHLSEKGAMSHEEELARAVEEQGDGDEHTLKPSRVRAFGRKEGARLRLREELGAGPSWTPEAEEDERKGERKRSEEEHAELDRQLDSGDMKSLRKTMNRSAKANERDIRKAFAKRRKALGPQAKERKTELREEAKREIATIQEDLETRLAEIDHDEENEKLFARIDLKDELANLSDTRGRFRRKVTRDPRKRRTKQRMAAIHKTYEEKRKTAKREATERTKAVKEKLKSDLRQRDIDTRREQKELDRELEERLAKHRNLTALHKRRVLRQSVPEVPRGEAPELGPGRRRNVLAEMNEIESTRWYENH